MQHSSKLKKFNCSLTYLQLKNTYPPFSLEIITWTESPIVHNKILAALVIVEADLSQKTPLLLAFFPQNQKACLHLIIIMSIPSNKAPGKSNDKILVRVIKDCLLSILPTISSVVNTSLSVCTFPTIWKPAEVTPIPKKGDHEQASNNGAISLLPVHCKVC